MRRPVASILAVVLFAGLRCSTGWAAEPANAENDRLRAALREATVQLRTAQSDLAALQATQTANADEKKELAAKFDTLKKQAATDQAASEQKLKLLDGQLAARKAENAQLATELAAARTVGATLAQNLDTTKTEATRVKAELAEARKKILSLEAKNVGLFLVGNEILRQFEDFSVGSALKAKEPFVGSTRTRLENLVQDFQDKLSDQRDRP